MKKVLIAMLVAAFIVPAFVGCKKGAEDPSISLKSRNSRLINTWKLTAIEGTYQYYSGGTQMIRTYTYDGAFYSSTLNPGATTTSGSGSFELTIDKDGAYSFKESFAFSGLTANPVSGESTWYWFGNDNSKIAVYIDGGGYLFSGGVYNIVRLSSKELKLHLYWKDVNNGEVSYQDITYSFEAA